MAIVLITGSSGLVSAQDENQTYKQFDHILGETNLKIYSGLFFKDDDLLLETDRYLFSDYKHAEVIYNNSVFYGYPIKYDLYNDFIIVKPKNTGSNIAIQLVSSNIESVNLEGIHLKNLTGKTTHKDIVGFYDTIELIDNVSFLVKYYKTKNEYIKGSDVYQDYKLHYKFYLIKDGNENLYDATKKENWTTLLPTKEAHILNAFGTSKTTDDLATLKELATSIIE
ncbi:hypothetical protein NBRC110019_12060 [Neptunitalea chrysea]|uniref:Uncharacterized protein n=1 Tax=Neptunitalea chrysea TaxID=1647581 RepID=A0A9W6B6F4_9FLAO|nr:hypothetical protein NBRC110019_12060 [Neptunitalea chrysea]